MTDWVATTDDGQIKIAYPKILSELDPNEAATLDRLCDQTNAEEYSWAKFGYDDTAELASITDLDNLNRLGLLRWVRSMSTTLGSISDENATLEGIQFTELGWAFVQACREPGRDQEDDG